MIAAARVPLADARDPLEAMLLEAGFENGWNKAEPSLDAAGAVVSTELAERRNLILANPLAGNRYPTASTLVSAYQMVKAGETARSHRHTPTRFASSSMPSQACTRSSLASASPWRPATCC